MPLNTWIGDIDREIGKWTDWHTDTLFTPRKPEESIVPVIFPYSRFYCDVERLAENEPLEAVGQGVFYTKFNGCVRLKTAQLATHAATLHQSHLLNLSSNIDCDNTLLIDCHSFPTELAPDVDICIGWNENESNPSPTLIHLLKKHFNSYGYHVAFNHPYGNSITPPSAFSYQSLMIEVNKRIYLTETNAPLPHFHTLHTCLQSLYTNILHKWMY